MQKKTQVKCTFRSGEDSRWSYRQTDRHGLTFYLYSDGDIEKGLGVGVGIGIGVIVEA